MRISVVLATYNGEEYLIDQLDSLRLQSCAIDELIICDDRSTDGTVEIIKDYIQRYNLSDNWKIHINKTNLGYAKNFYNGVLMATGDYIFFCDQDDIWISDKIEIMVNVMRCNNRIKLLCCDFIPLSSSMDAPKIRKSVMSRMTDNKIIQKIQLNYKNIYIGSLGCLMCITQCFKDEIKEYWCEGWAHDDWVWKLSQCTDGCYVYHANLIYRRLHSKNVSMKSLHTVVKRVDYLKQLLVNDESLLQFALDKKIYKKYIKVIQRNIKATRLRLGLVRDRKWINIIKLLPYNNCYHSRKSIFVEPYLVAMNK